MQPVLERGSIDKPLTFDVGLIKLSFIPVCSPTTCNISVKLRRGFALYCFSFFIYSFFHRITYPPSFTPNFPHSLLSPSLSPICFPVCLLCTLPYSLCVYLQDGNTALYLTSQEDHLEVVQLVLEKGADINICLKV